MFKYYRTFFSLFLAIGYTLSACNKTPVSSCIDPKRIDNEALCTMVYEPVCGCDQKTYSNACHADRAGITAYTNGPCAEKQR